MNNVVDSQIKFIGSIVDSRIKSRKINKADLAKHAGVSVNTVTSLIKGNNVNTSTAFSILNSLGYNLESLVEELHATNSYSIEDPQPMQMDEAQDYDVDALNEESQETSPEQTSMRLGVDSTELPTAVQAGA